MTTQTATLPAISPSLQATIRELGYQVGWKRVARMLAFGPTTAGPEPASDSPPTEVTLPEAKGRTPPTRQGKGALIEWCFTACQEYKPAEEIVAAQPGEARQFLSQCGHCQAETRATMRAYGERVAAGACRLPPDLPWWYARDVTCSHKERQYAGKVGQCPACCKNKLNDWIKAGMGEVPHLNYIRRSPNIVTYVAA